MDLYKKKSHLLSTLLAKSQYGPKSSSCPRNEDIFTPCLNFDSSKIKPPVNLFYSTLPDTPSYEGHQNSQPTIPKIHHNPDCSVVFITVESDTDSEKNSCEQLNNRIEVELPSDEDGSSTLIDKCQKKIKIESNQYITIQPDAPNQANQDQHDHKTVDESHSNANPEKNCQPRERKHCGSFDEGSDCSTACEMRSDGNVTYEALEFSPILSFCGFPRTEETRTDDDTDSFCLDSLTSSDEGDTAYMREAIDIASSFEGSCNSNKCSTSKTMLKFM